MPISTDDTVEMLNAKLTRKGGPALTMTWDDFYTECELDRLKDPRRVEICKKARDKYGLIVAFGRNVVLVAHDRNFAEPKATSLK